MNILTAMNNAHSIIANGGFKDQSIDEFTILIELPDKRSLYLGLDEDGRHFRFEVIERTIHEIKEDKPL